MKKCRHYIIGFLCASLIFGSTAVLANTDVLAKVTSQLFFWNDEKIELEAYNINGYNYVRLRDVAEIFEINVEYSALTDSVYLGTHNEKVPKEIIIDGAAYAKEDYSKKANPEIFNDVYTKEAYNTIRQSIVDIKTIVAGNNIDGYNAEYEYAHYVDPELSFTTQGRTDNAMKSVVSMFSAYYTFSFGSESEVKNLYKYPGYRICMPKVHSHFEIANTATEGFIKEISILPDREKVKEIADYVCRKIVYNSDNPKGLNDVFTLQGEVSGICGTYADAFLYLCQRADIPCITVQDTTHAWNEVYVDGEWKLTDIGYYDIARDETMLFPENYPRVDVNSAKTKFAKELLVPMSTK